MRGSFQHAKHACHAMAEAARLSLLCLLHAAVDNGADAKEKRDRCDAAGGIDFRSRVRTSWIACTATADAVPNDDETIDHKLHGRLLRKHMLKRLKRVPCSIKSNVNR